jgi:hypothetical protein
LNIFPAQELALLGRDLLVSGPVRAECLVQNAVHGFAALREILLVILSWHFLLVFGVTRGDFFEIQGVPVRL